jgi:hypothetical protein
MATLAEAQAKDPDVLTTSERNAVRRTLGESLQPGAGYTALEAVFPEDGSDVNRWLRAYLDDWDAISRAPTRLSGGADAIEYNTLNHQYVVYVDIALALGLAVKTFAVWSASFQAEGLQLITISLGGLYAESEL